MMMEAMTKEKTSDKGMPFLADGTAVAGPRVNSQLKKDPYYIHRLLAITDHSGVEIVVLTLSKANQNLL